MLMEAAQFQGRYQHRQLVYTAKQKSYIMRLYSDIFLAADELRLPGEAFMFPLQPPQCILDHKIYIL